MMPANLRFDKAAFSKAAFAFMEKQPPGYEWLNYHHLRYFYAVACEGSISGAAEKLRTSQSALCAQVKQLEAALGETLYRRAGRSIVLTDFGRLIQGYAEEIFAIGQEILSTAKRAPTARTLRLSIGIVDSFPKLLSLDVLRPVFSHSPAIHVACHEGKLEDLLGQLAAHRLDALLADEPPSSTTKVKVFDHELGGCGVTFCAEPKLARGLRGRFPRNLDGAPLLLPLPHTALRRDLEKWFRASRVQPLVVGEFEDAALAKIVATEGIGVIAVPTLVTSEAIERYGFTVIGRTTACRIELHLITAERRIEHPAVSLLAGAQRMGRRDRGRASELRGLRVVKDA
jgi:LysR family transcriptional activator of nhaA